MCILSCRNLRAHVGSTAANRAPAPSAADFVAMAAGKLTGMAAFMGGKMKLKGNMALAQKFGALAEAKKSKL